MTERVRVGVGVIVLDGNQNVLLGKRLTKYNNGVWAVPAGHVERGETFIGAAERELFEETGLKAKKLELVGLNNYGDDKGERQYVNIDFVVDKYEGILENKEPDLCSGWQWFRLDGLPDPLSPPTEIAIRALMTGIICVTDNKHMGVGFRLKQLT